ncbi:class I fructose-bisphosphate aldolase, partial [Amylibacter sp.]|nr:class I fructose-bisphosphate aldolase [Amylibacter sp.]
LMTAILENLNKLPDDAKVILKLSLPEIPNFYFPLINHPNVLRVVALSGGYDQKSALNKLKNNNGVIASFSRALTEGLNINQNDDDFNHIIKVSIDDIAMASSN